MHIYTHLLYADVSMLAQLQHAICITSAFDSGSLAGERPAEFPSTFFCLALEYMDRGTVKGLLQAAIHVYVVVDFLSVKQK